MSERGKTSGEPLDWVSFDTVIGAVVGAGAGVWAALGHRALENEETLLLAFGTAAIALLAVVLAAVALMAGFLNGFFGRVIEAASSTWSFFRPFQIVAVISALGALFSFGGAIEASHGAQDTRATVFGIAVFFVTWAVVGTAFLVREFINAAIEQREFLRKDEERRDDRIILTEGDITVTIEQHRRKPPSKSD